jgi:hypothetical protein
MRSFSLRCHRLFLISVSLFRDVESGPRYAFVRGAAAQGGVGRATFAAADALGGVYAEATAGVNGPEDDLRHRERARDRLASAERPSLLDDGTLPGAGCCIAVRWVSRASESSSSGAAVLSCPPGALSPVATPLCILLDGEPKEDTCVPRGEPSADGNRLIPARAAAGDTFCYLYRKGTPEAAVPASAGSRGSGSTPNNRRLSPG